MRVFKNKWFNHWARREGVADVALFHAAEEIVVGKVEATLGGCLFKKRLPRAGAGKRGGYRVLVGYKRPNAERIIFLYAFAKSEKGTISDREEVALSIVADSFISSSEEHVAELLEANLIWEVSSYE
ncbi:MAG: type II toxin-antitoxin system RelE/ParE family toxin [Chlorobium sp.]